MIGKAALLVLLIVAIVALASAKHVGVSSGSCPDGSSPVKCFVAPCTTAHCSVGCTNDYCGGCNAICSCASNADCPAEQFCRESIGQCAPYAKVGEQCGGYVKPNTEGVCAPGLECEHRPSIADLPGVCRQPGRLE